MTPPSVRDILAEQTGGISRPGLLAWCRLRIDTAMTETQLDEELTRLGDEVETDGGFLRLRPSAPTPAASQSVASGPPAWSPPVAPPPEPPAETPVPPASSLDRPARPGSALDAEPADAGRPFEWQPSSLAETAPETPVTGWVAPASGLSRGARIALLVGGVAAAIALTALSFGLGSLAEQATASLAPGAEMIDAYDLEVGDCVMWPEGDFDEIETRPCTSPHEAEVFFVGDLPRDGDFPEDDAFDAFVDATCVPAFADYTGSSFDDQDALDISWFSPTEESWREGDREMVCLVAPVDADTTDRGWRGGNP